jgi:hypothetical protein
MGTSEPPPLSPLEGTWRDNVKRERRLLEDHPDWTIKRLRPEGGPQTDVTYKASNGVVTHTSKDLGVVLDLVERAMREGIS